MDVTVELMVCFHYRTAVEPGENLKINAYL
jgi:hypothetical protein